MISIFGACEEVCGETHDILYTYTTPELESGQPVTARRALFGCGFLTSLLVYPKENPPSALFTAWTCLFTVLPARVLALSISHSAGILLDLSLHLYAYFYNSLPRGEGGGELL